jgi:hypothetical protein
MAGGNALSGWTETGDAGDLPGTAQVVEGSGPLDSISGELVGDPDFGDMYQIYIFDPAAFSAATSSGFDPQLFLFDENGMGVYANDDDSGLQPSLPPGHLYSPTTPGLYYLAITAFDRDPYSVTGLIFPSFPFWETHGPTEVGGGDPITQWVSSGDTGASYTIDLTGARYILPSVFVDIKPDSCPNPLNVKSKGVLPLAVLGTENLDVLDDIAYVTLEGVEPLMGDYEDVATPFEGELCDCHELGPDGYLDIVLHFDTEEIVAALGDVNDGEELSLTVQVTLADGTVIDVSVCVRILKKSKLKAVITSVVRDGVTEGQPEIVTGPSPGGLQEGSHAYMDRPLNESDTRNYNWENIPAELVGADYVMTYNEDKQPWYPYAYFVSYSVTLGRDAKLYVFVDQRYAPFPWLTDGSSGAVFADTGLDIILNEVGGSNVLRLFDVYGAEVPASTYILGPSCDGSAGRNFYSIAAAKL